MPTDDQPPARCGWSGGEARFFSRSRSRIGQPSAESALTEDYDDVPQHQDARQLRAAGDRR
jgi:hypothetical protein